MILQMQAFYDNEAVLIVKSPKTQDVYNAS